MRNDKRFTNKNKLQNTYSTHTEKGTWGTVSTPEICKLTVNWLLRTMRVKPSTVPFPNIRAMWIRPEKNKTKPTNMQNGDYTSWARHTLRSSTLMTRTTWIPPRVTELVTIKLEHDGKTLINLRTAWGLQRDKRSFSTRLQYGQYVAPRCIFINIHKCRYLTIAATKNNHWRGTRKSRIIPVYIF